MKSSAWPVMILLAAPCALDGEPAPLMRDLMGLNVHTVQFKPEIYQSVARHLRDYHGMKWDCGDDPATPTQFPFAANKVNWEKLYGDWKKAGYETSLCLTFSGIGPEAWKDPEAAAAKFGGSLAKFFGPGGKALVGAVEIGNEPGHYSDELYQKIFRSMAGAIRKTDPKLPIVTCAARAGESGKYWKSLELFRESPELYDVINLHSYAQVEGWPTWKRSFPEDPEIDYLKDVEKVVAWRDQHAPGKPVWITEFGWDASTKPAPKKGTFAKWQGSSEFEQAQWIVRSWLVFSAMPVDRAYLFWFNDKDTPQVHGSSGLTRNYKPKPAFHAVAHLRDVLAEFRFMKKLDGGEGVRVHGYRHATEQDRFVVAAWVPTKEGKARVAELDLGSLKPLKATRMAMKAGEPEEVKWEKVAGGRVRVEVSGTPVFIEGS